MMKVLMVITEGDLGGAQRHVLDVSRELVRRDHRVVIAVGGVFTDLSRAAAVGSPVVPVVRLKHLVRPIRPFSDVRAVGELVSLIRRERPDVVHCHSSKAGAVASLAGALAGVPVVYTAHGFVFHEHLSWSSRLLYIWAERISSLFRKKIITVSQSDFDSAQKRRITSARKLIAIPNGIDEKLAADLLDEAAARERLTEWSGGADFSGKKIVVCIANLYPAKNVPLLIHAFEFVVRRMPEARLVIVGDGEQRGICEKIIKQNPQLQSTVFLVGQKLDAYRILRGAAVLCLPSTKEGMPYTVLEAQLAGTPVVATRVGGVPEMGEEPMLRLVVPHSAEMLADAITESLSLNTRGKTGLRTKFTLQGMVTAIERVYEEVADSGKI